MNGIDIQKIVEQVVAEILRDRARYCTPAQPAKADVCPCELKPTKKKADGCACHHEKEEVVDFAKMTSAQKVAYHKAKWDRILG